MRAGVEKSQAVSISLRRCEVIPAASTTSSVDFEADEDVEVAIDFLLGYQFLVIRTGKQVTYPFPVLNG
jgi:hypothetical protein